MWGQPISKRIRVGEVNRQGTSCIDNFKKDVVEELCSRCYKVVTLERAEELGFKFS
jgi:hypothetical protein